MSAVTALLTVNEFRDLAETDPWKRYELHQGQVVEMTQPKFTHRYVLKKLCLLLDRKLGDCGEAFAECAYRGTPEYWPVNPVLRTVRVTNSSNNSTTYEESDSIPLQPFTNDAIRVADVFAF